MASDDEVLDDASDDPTFATAGPRRSTFTPPQASQPEGEQASDATHDDDELANALAADLNRMASGSIPLPTPEPERAPAPEPTLAAPAPVPAPAPDPDPAPAPVSAPAAADGRPLWSLDLPEVEPDPSSSAAPSPAPAPAAPSFPTAPPAAPVLPPWASAPAPDPTQASPNPERPVRRSLPDEDLARLLGDPASHPGGTLDALEQLEQQMQLREQEAREFRAWEATMLAIGTPDAASEVERARPEFTGVLPPSSGSSTMMPPIPAPAPPLSTAPPLPTAPPEPTASPLPTPPMFAAPAPEPAFDAPLPAWDVPAPSATWSPEPEPEPPLAPVPPAPASVDPFLMGDPGVPLEDPAPTNFDWFPVAAPPSGDAPVVVEPPALIEPPPFGSPVGVAPQDTLEIIEAEVIEDDAPARAAAATSGPPAPMAAPFDFMAAPPPPGPTEAPGAFSFDDLLTGAATAEILDEELPRRAEPVLDARAEEFFVDQLPVSADEGVPTDTDSIPVIDQAFIEVELDDDVDETDRVGGPGITGPVAVTTAGVANAPGLASTPSGPISTVRIPEDEVVLIDNEPVRQRVFSIEDAGLEPTPIDHRVGRAARLFWLWFAANSSVLSLGLGAVIFTVGMSLRQSIVAVLAGVALSFFPLGLTTLAGKRSGQPTMIVSRATFGVVGNVIPALLALVTRIFWGGVLLWLVASSVTVVLVGAGLSGPFGDRQLLLLALGATVLIAVVIAFSGYPIIAVIQLVLSIVSTLLIIGLIVMTAGYIDIGTALSTPDGSWLLTVTGAVLVFSFVGLVWANSGADLARYQRVGSSGAASMLWGTFGATLPSFVLIGYGALLAASNADIAAGFVLSPLDTLASMLPVWYPIPLLAATVLSLLSGIIISLYSGGFALKAVGVNVHRSWAVVILAVPLAGLAFLFAFGITGGLTDLFRDVATTIAVPTAAWAGIFAAEMMIRNRRFESESLTRRGGVYADVRWTNLIGLLAISGIGFGLTSATVSWLSWQGYAFTLLGVPLDGDLAGTDLGVLVALVLGILLPIVAGIPAIRRQEETRL